MRWVDGPNPTAAELEKEPEERPSQPEEPEPEERPLQPEEPEPEERPPQPEVGPACIVCLSLTSS